MRLHFSSCALHQSSQTTLCHPRDSGMSNDQGLISWHLIDLGVTLPTCKSGEAIVGKMLFLAQRLGSPSRKPMPNPATRQAPTVAPRAIITQVQVPTARWRPQRLPVVPGVSRLQLAGTRFLPLPFGGNVVFRPQHTTHTTPHVTSHAPRASATCRQGQEPRVFRYALVATTVEQ